MKDNFRAHGFTLVELLCVAAILSLIVGIAAVSFSDDGDEWQIVREEAESLREWLTAKMAYAAREGADFELSAHLDDYDVRNHKIIILWDGGSKNLQSETYYPQRAILALGGQQVSHIFDGEWFTITPALSFIIRSQKDSSIRLEVSVSAVGYADIKET